MDSTNKSKTLLFYSNFLKESSKTQLKVLYEDRKCSIFHYKSKEISLYSNGDIFIRSIDTENSSDFEIKKIKFTYNPKYQDPLQKSPFNINASNITTPSKESRNISPHNQSCKWKYGTKEDLEATNRLETFLYTFKDM
jgi:hypothetical protein